LTKYQLAINKAAYELCLDDPSLLHNRGELINIARKKIDDEGYCYKKKRSRSKAFGTGVETSKESKKIKSSAQFRHKRIQALTEDLDSLNTTMALLEKERYKQHNMKKYAQAASIEEQIAAKRKEKRSLTEEMTKLQEKEARSKRYYRSKESSSKNVKEKEQITKDKSASQLTLFQSGVKPKESICNDDECEKEDCSIVKVAHGSNEIVNEEKKSEEDSLPAHIVDDSTDVDRTAISMEEAIINNEKDIEEDKNTQNDIDVPFL
jgi:flagellar biosynthesis GTPase FlhF